MFVLHPGVVHAEGNWDGRGMGFWNHLLTLVTAKRSPAKTTAFRTEYCISHGCGMCGRVCDDTRNSAKSQNYQRTCSGVGAPNGVALRRGAQVEYMHSRSFSRTKLSIPEVSPKRDVCRGSSCTRIEKETRVAITGASEVHRALCAPEFQRIGDYEFASRVIPALHIGGDFVCTFQQGNQTFAVLGDLMGKGLSAAMWITHIVDLVHRAVEASQNTCDLLAHLNTEILNSRVRAPLTSAVAICVDHSTNQVSVASAGHPPAILVRGCSRVETIHEGGPIMGVFANARYACRDIELGRGDAIVAFSDGVIDAHNGDGEDF